MLLNYRMRFYLILFFCVALVITSCKNDKNIPADVIPEHEMAELLTDIHIIDGSLYDVPQIPDTLSKHGLGMYINVFRIHHVDTTLFNKSLKFYSTRPDLINEIYTGITKRLQKKIDSLQKIKPKEKPDTAKKVTGGNKADSLKKAAEKRKTDSLEKVKAQHRLDSIQRADRDLKVRPFQKVTPQTPVQQQPLKLSPQQKLPKPKVVTPLKAPVKKPLTTAEVRREKMRLFKEGLKQKQSTPQVVKPQN